MAGYDGRLQLVGSGAAELHCRRKEADALGDSFPVPEGAVLLLQWHQLSRFVHPGGATGVVKEHEGEQAECLGIVRHKAGKRARRMASALSPSRTRSLPALAEYPSLKSRYSTASTPPVRPGKWWAGGTR
jgi:hypothetical protein